MEAFLAGWPGQTHGTWLESRAARTWAPTTKATRCLLALLPRTPWATGYHPMILIRLFKTDFLVAWKVNNLFVFTRAHTHYFLLESERLFLLVYYMRMISQPLDGCVCLDQSPLAQTYLSLSILYVALCTCCCADDNRFLFFTLSLSLHASVIFSMPSALQWCVRILETLMEIFVLIIAMTIYRCTASKSRAIVDSGLWLLLYIHSIYKKPNGLKICWRISS